MNYTTEQKKTLFDKAEELMKLANIEIRDTWDGYSGENYDDLIANKGSTNGPKMVDFVKTKDGKVSLETKHYQLEQFKNLSYENSRILIPEKLAHKKHPLIHEAVHFLQYNTKELDDSWKGLQNETIEDFTKFVSQRSELEAHFVQLLYIDKHEFEIEDENLKQIFKTKLTEALNDRTKRIDLIVFAKENQIL